MDVKQEKAQAIEERLIDFAVRMIKLSSWLPNTSGQAYCRTNTQISYFRPTTLKPDRQKFTNWVSC